MKRTSKFIGSKLWRERDLSVYTVGPNGPLRAVDRPSGITITYYVPVDEAVLVADLAHRVRQLTT